MRGNLKGKLGLGRGTGGAFERGTSFKESGNRDHSASLVEEDWNKQSSPLVSIDSSTINAATEKGRKKRGNPESELRTKKIGADARGQGGKSKGRGKDA